MSPKDFIQAKKRISSFLLATPLLKSDILQKILGYESPIYLKLESEQPTRSFKVRGALNALLQLDQFIEKVVAFSSGNFAQAVAYGSAKLKKKAMIVMPQNAPRKKIDGTRDLGAEIVFCGERHEDGEIIVKELVEKEGYYPLHPFNSYQTISGQGTIAFEILETQPSIKHFFSPVGGGGLLSGCATVLKAYSQLTLLC
jgi:threonine dehydratase